MNIPAQRRIEVVRGFRLVANLLLGFVTIVLVWAGTMAFNGGDPGRFGKAGDFVALLVGTSILFATANRWKTWIAGFFGLPAVINAIGIFSSGHTLVWPYKPVPWTDGVAVLTFAVLLTALTFPNADLRKPSHSFDRACLTLAVVMFFVGALRTTPSYGWLACCLAMFAIVRIGILFLGIAIGADRANAPPCAASADQAVA